MCYHKALAVLGLCCFIVIALLVMYIQNSYMLYRDSHVTIVAAKFVWLKFY